MIVLTMLGEIYSSFARLYAEGITGNRGYDSLNNWSQGMKSLFNYYQEQMDVNYGCIILSIGNIESGKGIYTEEDLPMLNPLEKTIIKEELPEKIEIFNSIVDELTRLKKCIFCASLEELKEVFNNVKILQKRFNNLLVNNHLKLRNAFKLYTYFQDVQYFIYLELIHQVVSLESFYGKENIPDKDQLLYAKYLDIQNILNAKKKLPNNEELMKLLEEFERKVLAYGLNDDEILNNMLYQIHTITDKKTINLNASNSTKLLGSSSNQVTLSIKDAMEKYGTKENPKSCVETVGIRSGTRKCITTTYVENDGTLTSISEYSSRQVIPYEKLVKNRKLSNLGHIGETPKAKRKTEVEEYGLSFRISENETLFFDMNGNNEFDTMTVVYASPLMTESNILRIIAVEYDSYGELRIKEYHSRQEYLADKYSALYHVHTSNIDKHLYCDDWFVLPDGKAVLIITTIRGTYNCKIYEWTKKVDFSGSKENGSEGKSENIDEILFKNRKNFDISLYQPQQR